MGLPACPDWCGRDRDAGDESEQTWVHTRTLLHSRDGRVTLEQSWRWDEVGRLLRDPAEVVIHQAGHSIVFPAGELLALSRGFAEAAEQLDR